MLLAAPLLRLAAPGSCNLGSCAPRRRLALPPPTRATLLCCCSVGTHVEQSRQQRDDELHRLSCQYGEPLPARPSLIGCNPLSLVACSLQTRHATPLNSPPRPFMCDECQNPALVIRLCLGDRVRRWNPFEGTRLHFLQYGLNLNTAKTVIRSPADKTKVSMRRCAGPIKCQGPTLVGAPVFRWSGGFSRRLYFRNFPRTCLAQGECEMSMLSLYRVRKSDRGRERRV